jgi:hypothetical protein
MISTDKPLTERQAARSDLRGQAQRGSGTYRQAMSPDSTPIQ